jgi:DNA-binding response OmpR family regulator
MSNVLVIESDLSFQNDLSEMVRECNYKVQKVSNQDEGTEKLGSSRVQIILMDWDPSRDNQAFVSNIRRNHRTRGVHIIVSSQTTSRDFIAEILKTGVDDFLSRPFDTRELRSRLVWATNRSQLMI